MIAEGLLITLFHIPGNPDDNMPIIATDETASAVPESPRKNFLMASIAFSSMNNLKVNNLKVERQGNLITTHH
jgi:hypothetical protein